MKEGLVDPEIEKEDLEEGVSIKETDSSLLISSNSYQIKTLEDLLTASEVDLSLWKVDRWQVKTYEGFRRDEIKHLTFDKGKMSGFVDDDGNIRTVTMFAVRAWLVPKEEAPFEEVLDRMVERLNKPRKYQPVKPKYMKGSYACVLGTSDIHFTRLSLDGTYTPQNTLRDLDRVGDALLGRVVTLKMPVDLFIVPIGNDLLDVDNVNGTTTRGTWQQTCADIRDGIDAAVQGFQSVIEKAVKIAPVHIITVPGNHDRQSVYWLGKVLEAYFAQHPYAKHITIDNAKSPRKYYRYGKNLIGMEHGDKVAAKDLALIMAEESGCFDTTKYRTFFRGHFHKEKGMFTPISDTGAVHVVTYPAFCPQNNWELLMGYLGGNRAAEARFFHHDHGPAGVFPIFIDELA